MKKRCSNERLTIGKLVRRGRNGDAGARVEDDALWSVQLCARDNGCLRDAWATNANGCKLWMGATNKNAHGMYGGTPVHRLSSRYFDGTIPPGLEIHHTCGYALCCLPNHLQRVTRAEHHRLHKQSNRGVPVGKKLREEDVHSICIALVAGESNVTIAKRFRIHDTMVTHIRRGREWRSVSQQYFEAPMAPRSRMAA